VGIGFTYQDRKESTMLAFGMILLALVTFAAMLAFVTLCDWV
jgi:hypothetical protein